MIIWINILEQSFRTFWYLDVPFFFFFLSNQLPEMQSFQENKVLADTQSSQQTF